MTEKEESSILSLLLTPVTITPFYFAKLMMSNICGFFFFSFLKDISTAIAKYIRFLSHKIMTLNCLSVTNGKVPQTMPSL